MCNFPFIYHRKIMKMVSSDKYFLHINQEFLNKWLSYDGEWLYKHKLYKRIVKEIKWITNIFKKVIALKQYSRNLLFSFQKLISIVNDLWNHMHTNIARSKKTKANCKIFHFKDIWENSVDKVSLKVMRKPLVWREKKCKGERS